MTLQPHEGGNNAEPLDQKQRNPNGLRAYLPCSPNPYGIGAAWAVRNRAKIGVFDIFARNPDPPRKIIPNSNGRGWTV